MPTLPEHCPFLGCRGNRVVHFAEPTTEHRCYHAVPDAEITLDQAVYCLSPAYRFCPRLRALEPNDAAAEVAPPAPPPQEPQRPPAPASRPRPTPDAVLEALLSAPSVGAPRAQAREPAPKPAPQTPQPARISAPPVAKPPRSSQPAAPHPSQLAAQLASPQPAQAWQIAHRPPGVVADYGFDLRRRLVVGRTRSLVATLLGGFLPAAAVVLIAALGGGERPAVPLPATPAIASGLLTVGDTVSDELALSATPIVPRQSLDYAQGGEMAALPPRLASTPAAPAPVVTIAPAADVAPPAASSARAPIPLIPEGVLLAPTPLAADLAEAPPANPAAEEGVGRDVFLYFPNEAGVLVPVAQWLPVAPEHLLPAVVNALIAGPPVGLVAVTPPGTALNNLWFEGSALIVDLSQPPAGELGRQALEATLRQLGVTGEIVVRVNGQ